MDPGLLDTMLVIYSTSNIEVVNIVLNSPSLQLRIAAPEVYTQNLQLLSSITLIYRILVLCT